MGLNAPSEVKEVVIPVRFYKDYPDGYTYGYEDLNLPLNECCFLLVDVDGGYSFIDEQKTPHPITQQFIAPALAAARRAKMRVAYVHNDMRLVADPGNMAGELWSKTKLKKGTMFDHWKRMPPDFKPVYLDSVAPLDGEPNFPKWMWSGFHNTFLDQHLRSRGITTLFVVGYSQRACLHYTCAEAIGRNYRVILLRDCSNAPGEIEMPDTVDENLPQGGWVKEMMLRNFELLIGYTTTAAEFIAANDPQ